MPARAEVILENYRPSFVDGSDHTPPSEECPTKFSGAIFRRGWRASFLWQMFVEVQGACIVAIRLEILLGQTLRDGPEISGALTARPLPLQGLL